MNDVAATIEKPPSSLYDLSDDVNRCVLCESPAYELHREVTHYGFPFRFSRCHCGLIKQTPMPNEAFFEWFFNSDLFLSAKRARADQVWGFYDYLKDEPCRLATLAKYGFAAEASYRDVRIMHLEKILTLLAWNRLLAMIRALGVHLVRFPIYAYPSRIVVARKDRQSAV
jgi:hypothetical protein